MRYEIIETCKDYVDSFYRPPLPVRIRIQALEDHARKQNPGYHPPTKEWQ